MSTLTPSPLVVSLLLTAESLPFFRARTFPPGRSRTSSTAAASSSSPSFAMAVAVGTLAVVTLTGVVTPWMLLALAFALGIATALNDPPGTRSWPESFRTKSSRRGSRSAASASTSLARSAPLSEAFVVAASGPGLVFVIDALSFLGIVRRAPFVAPRATPVRLSRRAQ